MEMHNRDYWYAIPYLKEISNKKKSLFLAIPEPSCTPQPQPIGILLIIFVFMNLNKKESFTFNKTYLHTDYLPLSPIFANETLVR